MTKNVEPRRLFSGVRAPAQGTIWDKFDENFKTTFFQKPPMDFLDFGHFGFRGTYIKWCKWSLLRTQKKVLILFRTTVLQVDLYSLY